MNRELPAPMSQAEAAARRKGARRTALLFGGIALAIYLGFLAMGVVRA